MNNLINIKQFNICLIMPKGSKTPQVTRFPPEPSGYPHAGHLKAIFTNLKEAERTKGKTILRFDDTNPSTSKQEYVDNILMLLNEYHLLERFSNGHSPSYASDYFDQMLDITKQLISQGDAYVDESTPEEIRLQRSELKESPFRGVDPEVNLKKWDEFVAGKLPKCVVRLKISYNNPNACLRDPIVYRYNSDPHYRTGDKYCVYPTYDLACPVADSLDGVTLAMRTKEFTEKNDLAKWFFKKVPSLKSVVYKSYSRFVLEYSILSKRTIRKLKEDGVIDGWDDPRLDTLSAELRKGILPEAWEHYFQKHGTSNANGIEEWDKILKFNRNMIDDNCIRITAISQKMWQVAITGLNEDEVSGTKSVPWSPKDKDGKKLGMKQIQVSNIVMIDEADATPLKVGHLVYLLNFRAIEIVRICPATKMIEAKAHNEEFQFKDIPWKISWITLQEIMNHQTIKTTYYDYIITKPSITKDENVDDFLNTDSKSELYLNLSQNQKVLDRKGMIVQLVRFGYYIVDSVEPLNLVNIKEPGNKPQYLLQNNSPVKVTAQ